MGRRGDGVGGFVTVRHRMARVKVILECSVAHSVPRSHVKSVASIFASRGHKKALSHIVIPWSYSSVWAAEVRTQRYGMARS